MGRAKDRVKALREAQAAIGVTVERIALSTSDAVLLADELTEDQVRHPHALAVGLAAVKELSGEIPAEEEAQMAHAAQKAAAANKFWDAFEGQVVDGVEIIRRRA